MIPPWLQLLAPLFGANSLTQDEFTDAVSRINELAKFSYQFRKDGDSFNERSEVDFVGVLNTGLCSYISKSGPFPKSVYFETAIAVGSAACYWAVFICKVGAYRSSCENLNNWCYHRLLQETLVRL